MKRPYPVLASALILTIAVSLTGQSQTADAPNGEAFAARTFRLRGGLVNFTEGTVSCVYDGLPTRTVHARQTLANGDTIQTKEGRAEILLNPGYYLRLSSHAQAQLIDQSPDNLKIKLTSGSAILEIADLEIRSGFRELMDPLFDMVTLVTPRDEYAITRGGAYRFNVNEGAVSEVRVRKGLVIVAGVRVKDEMMAAVQDGRANLVSLDGKTSDAFDDWSRDRAVALVQSNKSLKDAAWYKRLNNDGAYLDFLDPVVTARSNSRTVSARNGVVTFVEDGMLLTAGGSAWQRLKAGDKLSDGDRVRIAAESRAEIRPYPYFYLYLGGNTEISYSELPNGQVTATVVKGAAAIDVIQPDPKPREPNALRLIAGHGEIRITKKGNYRLNILSEGKAEMLVYDGAVETAGREIKATRRVVLTGSGATEHPLDKQTQDSFDVWSSRKSARQEVRFTRRFRASAGLWCLNESLVQYTFVPAGGEYSSPYGGRYSIKYRRSPPFPRPRPKEPERPPLIKPIGPSNLPVARPVGDE